jgi:hypothetical protein
MKKLITRLLILGLSIIAMNICSAKFKKSGHKKKIRQTPKAIDLHDHYGASNVGSPYGKSNTYEEYVEKNPEVFTPHKYNNWKKIENSRKFKPYPGWEEKFNPHHIKSGDFTNIAPSAEKIINPEITGPKISFQGEINYPSHVKVPTFYGYKRDFQNVAAYDRVDGKIIEDNVVVTKPIYGWEDKVKFFL